ncbi:hypothetical protein IWW37_004496 [Coemansia sp. RSA 2050]|nr:hypothetical protein IWW37_004496 [Coemansia sp. RSA 2050]KAJ2731203.1 hypothetical protein IW152_004717 [Coemansia sp. BCRC 34962]
MPAAGDISVSSSHRHSHPHNISHSHNRSRQLSGSSTPTAMPHHHTLASAQSHEYLHASQSPVPSLTNATLRSSSVSSSVNSLSPDAHQATTPRDLLPQFKSVGNVCHAPIGSVANNLDADEAESKKRRRDEERDAESKKLYRDEKEEGEVQSGSAGSAPPPLPQQPEGQEQLRTRHLVNGKRRPLTGSTDFIKLCGLTGLYDEFVRPYIVDGKVKRKFPDLASSEYLHGVKGAMLHCEGAPDLIALIKAPPKTQYSKLEPIPMASLRAAFSFGGVDKRAKRPSETTLAAGGDERAKKLKVKVGIAGYAMLNVVALAAALCCC